MPPPVPFGPWQPAAGAREELRAVPGSPSTMSFDATALQLRLRRVHLRQHEDVSDDDGEQRGRDVDAGAVGAASGVSGTAASCADYVTSQGPMPCLRASSSTWTDLMTSVFSTGIAAKAWFASAAVFFAVHPGARPARASSGSCSASSGSSARRQPRPPLVGPPRDPLHAAGRLPLHLHPRASRPQPARPRPLPRSARSSTACSR